MSNINQSEIQDILRKFRVKTQVLCSGLFTEDGFLITVEQAGLNENDDYHESMGAICANIIALAAQGIEIIHSDKNVKQISIKTDENRNEGFEIILEFVTNDVMLSVMFSSSLNLGVVLFELNKMIQKLKKYFSEIENDDALSLIEIEQIEQIEQ